MGRRIEMLQAANDTNRADIVQVDVDVEENHGLDMMTP